MSPDEPGGADCVFLPWYAHQVSGQRMAIIGLFVLGAMIPDGRPAPRPLTAYMGRFGRDANPASVGLPLVLPALDAQLYGPGRARARESLHAGDRPPACRIHATIDWFFLHRARVQLALAALVVARFAHHGDRQPGGDRPEPISLTQQASAARPAAAACVCIRHRRPRRSTRQIYLPAINWLMLDRRSVPVDPVPDIGGDGIGLRYRGYRHDGGDHRCSPISSYAAACGAGRVG